MTWNTGKTNRSGGRGASGGDPEDALAAVAGDGVADDDVAAVVVVAVGTCPKGRTITMSSSLGSGRGACRGTGKAGRDEGWGCVRGCCCCCCCWWC